MLDCFAHVVARAQLEGIRLLSLSSKLKVVRFFAYAWCMYMHVHACAADMHIYKSTFVSMWISVVR